METKKIQSNFDPTKFKQNKHYPLEFNHIQENPSYEIFTKYLNDLVGAL